MIRKAVAGDFDFVYSLYMHPDVNEFLLYEPMDKKSFEPIFQELTQSGVLYIFLEKDHPTGMFKWIRLTHRTSHVAYLGGLAIHPGYQGRGAGSRMMNEILAFGKQMGLKRVELSATATNDRAIRLYEKSGFQREGLLHKYSHFQKNDLYQDEILMAYLY